MGVYILMVFQIDCTSVNFSRQFFGCSDCLVCPVGAPFLMTPVSFQHDSINLWKLHCFMVPQSVTGSPLPFEPADWIKHLLLQRTLVLSGGKIGLETRSYASGCIVWVYYQEISVERDSKCIILTDRLYKCMYS